MARQTIYNKVNFLHLCVAPPLLKKSRGLFEIILKPKSPQFGIGIIRSPETRRIEWYKDILIDIDLETYLRVYFKQ